MNCRNSIYWADLTNYSVELEGVPKGICRVLIMNNIINGDDTVLVSPIIDKFIKERADTCFEIKNQLIHTENNMYAYLDTNIKIPVNELKNKIVNLKFNDICKVDVICIKYDLLPKSPEALLREKIKSGKGNDDEVEKYIIDLVHAIEKGGDIRFIGGSLVYQLRDICNLYNRDVNDYMPEKLLDAIVRYHER